MSLLYQTNEAQQSDLQAVERVLAGDTEAFAEIVRRWQGPLVNMAWRYCRDRQRAEEMAQEAFVRVWRGLASWRRDAAFSTWMFALAANVFRNELKRFPTEIAAVDEVDEPVVAPAQLAIVEGQRRDEAVRRAVLALPERYREPVILFYFHEKNVDEAAQTMGVPTGTLKARLKRARDLLKKRFPQLACLARTETGREAMR